MGTLLVVLTGCGESGETEPDVSAVPVISDPAVSGEDDNPVSKSEAEESPTADANGHVEPEAGPTDAEIEVAIRHGQAIFEVKGNCTVCHTIGGNPDTGRGPDLAGMGIRAEQRAAKFGLTGANAAADYLMRTITHPAEEIVEGYNAMPESWLPSGLTDEDLRDLVLYLQSLGGSPDPTQIVVPKTLLAGKRQEYARELEQFASGDPARGKILFHDANGTAGCIKCHSIDGQGENICPDLSFVNHVQRPGYIRESIVDSSATLVRGYQQLMIWDKKGMMFIGLPKDEDDETITLVIDDQGTTKVVRKDQIDDQLLSEVSIMPGNIADLLSEQEMLDIIAYLLQHDGPVVAPVALTEAAPEAALPADETEIPTPTEVANADPETVSPPMEPADTETEAARKNANPVGDPATDEQPSNDPGERKSDSRSEPDDPEVDENSPTPAVAPLSFDVFDPKADAFKKYRRAMERGDPVIGGRLYSHYCIMCHGPDGTGTGFNSVNLDTKPANHTDDRRMAKTDDRLLHGVVWRGGTNTGRSVLMPPWGGTLSQRQMWDLVAYLRTLHTDVDR